MSEDYDVRPGRGALLISAPHVGTQLPADLAPRLTEAGRSLVDTDWYADRLYPFARELDATVLRARWSRYAVDLNRDPSGASLYPGATTTGFVPTETFEGDPLYAPGDEPGEDEAAGRRARYFDPYHAELAAQIARIRAEHGGVLLIDAHSIWGTLPRLFEGELPVVNLGTNSGRSCDPALVESARAAVASSPYSVVIDGRFKGGYITRHYGDPASGVQALQIEINQQAYLADGSRTLWDDAKAARLSRVLNTVCTSLVGFQCPQLRPSTSSG
ncbi:MAG: N-formylglutamate amidohydrolase [Candidatus Eremiobacteraeota bacterium]|nr:N-formylglutamate amidohydrolase [Candidatus Eremiobacteraeota bacterium]